MGPSAEDVIPPVRAAVLAGARRNFAGLLPAARWAELSRALRPPWLAALVTDAAGRPCSVWLLCPARLAEHLLPVGREEAARQAELWLRGRRPGERAGAGEYGAGLPAALELRPARTIAGPARYRVDRQGALAPAGRAG